MINEKRIELAIHSRKAAVIEQPLWCIAVVTINCEYLSDSECKLIESMHQGKWEGKSYLAIVSDNKEDIIKFQSKSIALIASEDLHKRFLRMASFFCMQNYGFGIKEDENDIQLLSIT